MRLIPLALALAAAAYLASCGGSADPAPLGTQQQQARLQGCMQRMAHYQQLGVWNHGGAQPGVDRAGWDKLADEQREEVFEVAGCIAAAGQVGAREVTVVEGGTSLVLETRRMKNDKYLVF